MRYLQRSPLTLDIPLTWYVVLRPYSFRGAPERWRRETVNVPESSLGFIHMKFPIVAFLSNMRPELSLDNSSYTSILVWVAVLMFRDVVDGDAHKGPPRSATAGLPTYKYAPIGNRDEVDNHIEGRETDGSVDFCHVLS